MIVEQSVGPVLEVARLDVRPGQEAAFERAISAARPLIAATPGFVSIEIRRCFETPSRYLLLVAWERLEDHMIGFRQSDRYAEWKALLHHFYDPFPVVEHYAAAQDLDAGDSARM
ncbi:MULTISPECIES: antibiotic biosynthesis monooxygenase family protein [Methylosinus]|uniref:Antibiotic biosynthesis monooxygenase n=1 Tax=Methylosinus trichosporium (strain ATCC 35070 / NCIMB 11131 / UNIQEM 75 / OB3b) TaxID=595536 RepID=A0A2D2D1M9_METT3|nr:MULTISPECIES: antibiotic biosynthesis monooxygenase [Methylosinus]ATQ68911.1 antibiotic biosynthesis monooxygenase [Methylosinus trichosporium OB3b]OBS52295.1 antibiotic biosynthesis monooxygenase [Methylosinus sp. 3S-1]